MKKLLLTIFLISFAVFIRGQSKISDNLWAKIAEAQEKALTVESIIFLEDKYDTEMLNKHLKEQKATPHDRAVIVNTTLRQHANQTQRSLIELLESNRSGSIFQYHTFWVTNAIFIEASPDFIIELADHPDIASLKMNKQLEPIKAVESKLAPLKLPGHAEPGLKVINAHKMWELGFTGEGIIVANLDSGVEGDHPALQSSWLGNTVPAEQSWYDPGGGTTSPTDIDGHGTRTMGIIVGLDPNTSDTIGVAFNAKWIAARGTLDNNDVLLSLEWFLDPDGNPSTTDDIPDVINNSWGDYIDCSDFFLESITNLNAAGVAMIFAAGNDGPTPGDVLNPANLNLTNMTAFSVGAVNGYHEDLSIADFSSRGPTPCTTGTGDSIKPEIVAPGVYIRSSSPGDDYIANSGTSYAAPHIAGAVALLKQAFPDKSGDELMQMLYENARDLGTPGEDNDYGMGIADVYAAYMANRFPGTPKPTENLTAYSDYLSPSAVSISWTDPEELVGGGILTNFEIRIWRDGEFLTSVPSGEEMYIDEGLNDGQSYQYELLAKDLNTDSLSLCKNSTVYCGGSPLPACPTEVMTTYSELSGVTISWSDPVNQSDGTPLDDLSTISLYCNDEWITDVDPGEEIFIDNNSFTNNATNIYSLKAVDTESPQHKSGFSKKCIVYTGDHPEILVWVGEDVSGSIKETSEDILWTILSLNSHTYLTNDLSEFGDDLNIYNAIFTVLGVWPHNHMLSTGQATMLEDYLENGGNLYVEGSDCYFYDPEYGGGIDIRPWFSLDEGLDGFGDVFFVDGINELDTISLKYNGLNVFMDELEPLNSIPILMNPENDDILGVWWDAYGTNGAKTIGVVPSYGGFLNTTSTFFKEHLMCRYLNYFGYDYDCDSVLIKIPTISQDNTQHLLSVSPVPLLNTATIQYELKEATSVIFEIYNLQGVKIKTLVNDYQSAGEYTLRFDASALPAGIYFVTLKSSSERTGCVGQTQKIIKL